MNIREYNFNFGWKFCDHDCDGKNFDRIASDKYKEPQWTKAGNNGLAVSNFDDSTWEDIQLPHDFVIEKCDFTPEESDSVGSLRKGMAWYRKTFKLPEETKNKRVFIRFDGAFRDSQVWCNGHFMGRHLGGYLGFEYELTEVLNRDSDNTIAVFVNGTGYEGWWYEGGGIYRDAFLVATSPVRIKENGVFVKPFNIDLYTNTCDVDVQIELDSNKFKACDVEYSVSICNPQGEQVASYTKNANANPLSITTVKDTVKFDNISYWNLESPMLYTAKVTVKCGDEQDELEQAFGVRTFVYDAVNGLKLNGKTITLNGACGHDDLAGIGTALNASAMEYKIKRLQDIGCNSYRCSHNPPSPKFLDLCDKMGFIVLDEHRLPGTSFECLDDFKTLIERDRNHPSVIFYSMGNEEMGIQNTKVGVEIFSKMMAMASILDDSRDCLFAINCDVDEIIKFLRANGYDHKLHGANYLRPKTGPLQHQAVHDHNPDYCFVSTETTGMCMIRGYSNDNLNRPTISKSGHNCSVWLNKKHEGLITCYGDCGPFWGLTPQEALQAHDGRPYFLGQYIWTGFDYRGEVFPYEYPQTVTSFGILDLCGFEKDWAYYTKAWWLNEPVLHIFPSWNLPFAEGEQVSVWAFSNCDEVELFLNGKSLGKKPVERLGHIEWDTTYEKGELKAIGYKDGKELLTETLVTSDKEYSLVLKTEKTNLIADHDDTTMVTVEVVDKNGNYVTDSAIDVDFTIEGGASIKGTGNGNPQSLEHDKAPKRKLFAGKAMVIVESTFEASNITLTATSKNILPASIELKSEKLDTLNNYIFSTNDAVTGNLREQYIDM